MSAYTPAEDAYIIAHYASATLRSIGEHLGRPWQCVQGRCDRLAQHGRLDKNQRYYQRPWTEEDEDWLADNYGKLSDAVVCAHLKRTRWAITVKAKRLGINRKMAFWNASHVADLFGVDRKTITHWKDRGWLTARRSPITQGKHPIWHITEEEIERFICQLPWAYDLALMRKGDFLTDLAKEVHQADPWLTTSEAAKLAGVCAQTLNRWCNQEGLPSKRRPKLGTQAGPWQGLRMIRKTDLVAWLAEKRVREHRNRSEACKSRRRRENLARLPLAS